MSFVDELRKARSTPIAAFHEFKTNIGDRNRLHAFVEGRDDEVFYGHFLREHYRHLDVKTYKCGNKRQVYETFRLVLSHYPQVNDALFFVDKDWSDLLGEAWPNDDRIYVTEAYSVENYLVTEERIEVFVRDFFRVAGVHFDLSVVRPVFARVRRQFYLDIQPLIAWLLTVRAMALKPNVGNVNLSDFIALDSEFEVTRKRNRVARLEAVSGAAPPGEVWRECCRWMRILRALQPKQYVRGKFDVWILLEFLRKLETQLRAVAAEVDGTVTVPTILHARNVVDVLTPRIHLPDDLDRFLRKHAL